MGVKSAQNTMVGITVKTPNVSAVSSAKKRIFAGNFIKMFVFAFVGLALVTGTFFFENRLADGENIEDFRVLTPVDADEYYFSEDIVVRASDGCEFDYDFDEAGYVLSLADGEIWVNSALSLDDFYVYVGGRIVLNPRFAQFSVEYVDDRMILRVYDGDVYAGFLRDGSTLDSVYLNELVVPSGMQITVPISRITSNIEPLLYSKLSKEFKLTSISIANLEDEKVLQNIRSDNKFRENVKQEYVSQVLFENKALGDGLVSRVIFWIEEKLSFVPAKKNEMFLNHLFGFLDNAIYYSAEGDNAMTLSNLAEFSVYLDSLSVDVELDSYIQDLLVFDYGDDQYDVLQKLLDIEFTNEAKRELVIGVLWRGVYRAIDTGELEAQSALDSYYAYLDKSFDDINLVYQNQLFGNLFLKDAVFYKDDFFAMKNAIELALLDQYSEASLREEVAQDIISEKIQYLKMLQSFFFDEEIDVDEAREIVARLISEIDDLMPIDTSGVAVLELFESRLDDIDDFWGYLKSPEYYSSKTYGLTHEERYQSYLSERDKIWTFIDIQQEVLGEVGVDEPTLDEVEEMIVEDIMGIDSNVYEVAVKNLEDVSQRFVEIEGVVGGYPFEGKYDRESGTIEEVYAYDEIVSENPIKIESLFDLIVSQFADLAEEYVNDGEFNQETNAQIILKRHLVSMFVENGFVIEIDDIMLVDEDDSVYRVENVYMEDYQDVSVTFDFVVNGEKIKNLYLEVSGKPVVLDGEYDVEEMIDTIVAQYSIIVEGKVTR